jgi:hypothetical protein
MNPATSWNDATKWESSWWGKCLNTYSEETKQLTYARKMGLRAYMFEGKYPIYNLQNKSVIDIGGGPTSMLLKCINVKGVVIDPCLYPGWIEERYRLAGIIYVDAKGEDLVDPPTGAIVDEIWIYNVLQHTDDPAKIIQNARKISKVIRIFEWINTPVTNGHIHTLTKEKLDAWLGGQGKTEILNENNCVGECYYGIFKGDHYEA